MIALDNVTKSFGARKNRKNAIRGVTASVPPGQITGLVGPDGAGKTTMLRLFCGLLVPDEGQISVMGLDTVRDFTRIREITGYMPQRFGLYEDLTVMENLRLQANLRGVAPSEQNERYGELLRFTDLAPFTGRLAARLSGGMKQKLGLACTLLSRPSVLLLDEPGVGVDPAARRELWRMMRELISPNRVVVWSTSYLEEAEVCDSVLLLNEGKLLYEGPPKDLSARAAGRTFLIDGAGERRRALIAPAMSMKETLDAVIQGARVRVLTRDNGEELAANLASFNKTDELGKLTIEPAPPRFEDAFMDILGGARPGNPAVADLFDSGYFGETVSARGLFKRFGSFTAVGGISFSINRGEIFGLLGPNGAGKSTTFKMLCGLLAPTSGECSIVGADFKRAPMEARSRLGYMAQKFSLYGDLSVFQNLDFFSGVYGLRGIAKKKIVGRVIEAFGLERFLKTDAKSLPLGYKQRLAMGCAIMHGPDALFLDEPTSGVDPVTRREFWTYINRAALKGVTVMVTTHFMDEAEYCDRVALVYKGHITAMGTPDELKASVADKNNPDPTLEDAFIRLIEREDEIP